MKQFNHKDYKHYRSSQINKNREKKTMIWVQPNELKLIAKAIIRNLDRKPQFGICHGVRTGHENKILSKLLGIKVVGTDLIGTDNIKMDFHDEAPQWKHKADFIYTNSLDHSYDPDLALRRWIDCLRPGGVILVHWDIGDSIGEPTSADCFRASADEYRTMLSSYGKLTEETVQRYKPKKDITIDIILFILIPKQEIVKHVDKRNINS